MKAKKIPIPPDTPVDCWNCRHTIATGDNFCRYCGKGQGKNISWYYKPAGIIFLTLLALGPFTLGFVWKSPHLSPRAKWIYSILIVLLTLYLIQSFYQTFNSVMNTYSDILGQMQ